jgi:hypothetical protein
MSRSDTELYKELCKMRASVEGTMEKLRPEFLKGRIKFRSLPKVKMRMTLREIALNTSICSQDNLRLFILKNWTYTDILRVFAGSPRISI